MSRNIFLAAATLFFCACAPRYSMRLKNSHNGDIKVCKRDPSITEAWEEKRAVEECIRKYKMAGYDEFE